MIVYKDNHEIRFSLTISPFQVLSVLFPLALGITWLIVIYSQERHATELFTSGLRHNFISQNLVIDSLKKQLDKEEKYLVSIRKALTGDIYDDLLEDKPNPKKGENINRFIVSRNREDSLLRDLEHQEEKYTIPEKDRELANLLLSAPAKGSISQVHDPTIGHYGVDISLSKNSPIKAAADGTVIFSEWSIETGYVIALIHSNHFISIYKHNSSLKKKQGDFVYKGEVIATAGNSGEFTTGWHLHFEIWNDGLALDPQELIEF